MFNQEEIMSTEKANSERQKALEAALGQIEKQF